MNWLAVIAVHLLLYPIYQVMSTLRHELCHVIAGVMNGLHILDVHILPCKRDNRWYFGYTLFDTWPESIHVYLAPYYLDLVCLAAGFAIWNFCRDWLATLSVHAYIVVLVMLVLSPGIDILYNIANWLLHDRGDFALAFREEQEHEEEG